jgi:hypothetical protein
MDDAIKQEVEGQLIDDYKMQRRMNRGIPEHCTQLAAKLACGEVTDADLAVFRKAQQAEDDEIRMEIGLEGF